VVGTVLDVVLKRPQATLQQQPDLVSLLPPRGTEGLVVIFEYLIEERGYLDDALVRQPT
jgi:hypothetical protein